MEKKHLLKIMRITIRQFFICLLFFGVTKANTGFTQNALLQKINFSISNQNLKQFISQIEKKTDLNFIYSPNTVNDQLTVSANFKETTVEDILTKTLSPLGISFVNSGNLIMLKSEFAKTPIERIKGTVKDKTGAGIPGVTVQIKGTSKGTSTDANGNFEIAADLGQTLILSFVGYKSQEILLSESAISVVLEETSSNLSELAVIGSRGKPRTDVERPVPVDVISAKEIQATGQTDLGQMIQFTSPSFNSAKYGINGTTNYAEPATLRGMSPDQSLLLINGKRRHQFAALNLNVAPGVGTVVSDLNAIPSIALNRVEILRDGAAAQYGSDAIAGIINLDLKESINQGTLETQVGIYKAGDGLTYKTALNYGFGLGKKGGFINASLNYFHMDETNRTDNYTGRIYNADAVKDAAAKATRGVYPATPFKIGVYGSNQNDTYQSFVNIGLPISKDWKFYAFGGTSKKDINAYGFFRQAYGANATPELFPDGYVPRLPGTAKDYSFVAGIKNVTKDNWNYDFSYGYGHNYLDLWANNTTNPSMGASSPTEFYVGRNAFGQSNVEANVSKAIEKRGSLNSLNLAFGAQYRKDNFEVTRGSTESYQVGDLALKSGKAVGSSGRPGIAPADEVNISRSNVGAYVDVEADVTKSLLLSSALRYENYSDFGSNVSGKLAARLKLTNSLSIRGSVNKGFRAPSLAQVGNRVNTSTVQSGVIIVTKQVSNDDPGLATLGIAQPKAETSWNYNTGLTGSFLNNALLVTLDAFLIDITDRIVITNRLLASAVPAVKTTFPNSAEIRFFTNHINTRTKGIDFVTSYKKRISGNSNLNFSVAVALNETKVLKQKDTPASLLVGVATAKRFNLLDSVAISLIEVGQPKSKILGSVNYQYKKMGITLRATRFGEVKAYDTNIKVGRYGLQTFKAKTLTDVTVNCNVAKFLNVAVGANNIFDVYPDKWDPAAAGYSTGQVPYTRNANQFGFNGAFYYLNATFNF